MAEEARQYLFKNTTFTYKGEKYHYIDGKIVDSSFLALSSDIENDVNHFVYGQVNYKALNTQKIIDYIQETKSNRVYDLSANAINYLLTERNIPETDQRKILPMLTSICRAIGKCELAIEYAEKYLDESFSNSSAALLTSLSAAYCDVDQWEKARRFAKRAYALYGPSYELSLVFKRIEVHDKKEN